MREAVEYLLAAYRVGARRESVRCPACSLAPFTLKLRDSSSAFRTMFFYHTPFCVINREKSARLTVAIPFNRNRSEAFRVSFLYEKYTHYVRMYAHHGVISNV